MPAKRKSSSKKKVSKKARKGLTVKKAKKILREGIAKGRKLTPKQKRFFGLIAGGRIPSRLKSRKKK